MRWAAVDVLNTVPIPGDTETGDIVRGPGGEVAMDNPGGLPINDFDLLCDMEDVKRREMSPDRCL